MPRNVHVMRAVQHGLDDLDIAATASDRDRTTAIKTKLCEIGRTFQLWVGAHAREVVEGLRDHGEWLYDVTWLEYEGDLLTDAPLVAECEWRGGEEIDHDFQKLLLARAGVRLMIFNGEHKPCTQEIVEDLARQVGRFKRSGDDDAWLLAAWEQDGDSDQGWSFRWFTVKQGAAKDFPPLRPSGG